MKIGETILKLREEKKMSQEEFAQYYHVTRQTISNWEKEKNYPDLQTLVKISDESGVPLDSMLKDNFSMVQEIDKKVRHLKIFKIGTIVVLAIVILVSAYIGIQNGKQDHLVRTYEDKLEELGFEQEGNNYCLTDSDFKYDIYMFDRPSIWKWNQEMSDREKFIVATLLVKNSDLEENPGITIRKTGDFITLYISRENHLADDGSTKPKEYSLDRNGQIKHKTAINSVYGLTSASFDNPFRDPRNIDNIVAKRGALFMIDLKNEVLKRGFQVAHIKTDSIKIPDATPEIIQFVMDFGERYGYTFEHEATYDRMCLVNDAVYIAKYKSAEECQKMYGYIPEDNKKKGGKWTATGTQFQIPYVFKKLFSREEIAFEDMCETKSVSSSLYLDLNEGLPDVSKEEKEFSKAESDYKKGLLSDTTFETTCQKLTPLIEKGHDYHFIGKVGQFCPMKDGYGAGLLMREKDGRYYAATGSKGYRWMESEMVKELGKEDGIDRSYYDKLVDEAVKTISQYGDFEWFVSDDPYVPELGANDADVDCVVPWAMPCGEDKYRTCFDCPHFNNDNFHMDCDLDYDISDIVMKHAMNPPEN